MRGGYFNVHAARHVLAHTGLRDKRAGRYSAFSTSPAIGQMTYLRRGAGYPEVSAL